MLKRIFLCSAFLALPTLLPAQDAYTGASASAGAFESTSTLRRSLLVYLYGNSGNLNKDANQIFSDNDTEFGLRYSQNFEKAPWLTLGVQADLSMMYNWNYNADNSPVANGGTAPSVAVPILRLSLGMSRYTRIDMTTEGLISLNLFYTYQNGRHFLTFLGNADLKFINFSNSEYTFGVAYEYKIPGNWIYNALLGFRFGGGTPAAVRNTFHIRWDNLIGYTVNGVTLWGRLRYEPKGFLIPDGTAKHYVSLMAGINYNFNFTAL